ncbi:Hypothetical predicted protein [Paramuricea clavata]|uniref:Uncharacterized protein n=1 Tax=Paramuricea clavata TaxID=317549 RepID=A0A6S7I7N5_PARCT|nr:Hypothetical predicted protein [Paramuricea clavata]
MYDYVRHGDLSYQAKNASGRRKGYMEIMKELWEEKGYASLGYTTQNLRDKAAQVLKTTERTFSNSCTNDVNETSVNYFENEESDLAHNLNNQRCEIHSIEDTKPSHFDPILYNRITSDTIRDAANKIQGSAGPSGVDAHLWRRFCLSYKTASSDLCNALAGVARLLCTKSVHPEGLSAFVACRLIPLDKDPGICPIGIGEVPRRIIAKAILRVVRDDVKEAVGPLQTCAAKELFENTGITITTDGHKMLGAACGKRPFVEGYVADKIKEWDEEIMMISKIAISSRCIYCTFSCNYWEMAISYADSCDVGEMFQVLENRIANNFIPALTGREPCSNEGKSLLSLPTRHGGLNLPNPVDLAKIQHDASLKVTEPLKKMIISQTMSYERLQVHEIKAEL